MTAFHQLTPEQRDKILQLYKDGIPVSAIVARFGCDKNLPGKLALKAGYEGRKRRPLKGSRTPKVDVR